MRTIPVISLCTGTLLAVLAARADTAKVPPSATFGPNPTLASPHPTSTSVHVAPAKGWPEGAKPTATAGFTVGAFASGLDHPRWLYVLPNGDVLVAETNAPERPDEGKTLKGKAMKVMMKKAGAGVPSANRITLLRDADGDGVAEVRTTFLQNLNSPFGMALVGQDFYVANTDALVRFPYHPGDTQITVPPTKLADLPAGPQNHHWTKNVIANRDGSKLYVTVGSNSNAAENGLEKEKNRACILEIDAHTGQSRVYASGLRNPVGLAWEPETGALWTSVNERDELGSDLVPDFMTAVREGAFYGWPFSYYGQHVDDRVKPQQPDLVSKAIVPDYALGAHTASLGLAFNTGPLFGRGAFVGQHGSWNRKPLAGYKVIFVPFQKGKPSGPPQDVVTGFLNADGDALGRPVGVAFDRAGALLVADDVGNKVWRVTPANGATNRVAQSR
jgi:glucose/arabinose dehydrogenase